MEADACFSGDTQVRTRRGFVRFDELAVGDQVLSAPEGDPHAAPEFRQVEEVFQTFARVWHLHVKGEIVRTTPQHEFFVWGKGWVPARALQPGDMLRSEDNRFVPVEDICDGGYEEAVYNCRVAEYHTYFVGIGGWGFSVWAHNEFWSTARRNYWKNVAAQEAANPTGMYSIANLRRMADGNAPLMQLLMRNRTDPTRLVTQEVSVELHHMMLTQRGGSPLRILLLNFSATCGEDFGVKRP